MKKLLVVFALLLLIGVAVEVSAQEAVINKPFCYSQKGLQNLVDVLNNNGSEDDIKKALDADCMFQPVLIILGETVGNVRLGGRWLNVKEVLVLGFAGEGAILGLPEPVVMYGTFPIDGKEA